MSDLTKDEARNLLEDAVWRALEAGMTEQEVREEVAYALDDADDA